MIKLFSEEEYNLCKNSEKLPLQCEHCGKTFYVPKRYLSFCLNHSKYNKNRFCSTKCANDAQRKKINIKCSQCGKDIERVNSQIKKSKNGLYFCSRSCACKYHNFHKTKGVRRSKLEIYIEEQLASIYSELEILYNNKSAINSELDIYIPSLKLAFELNGIFHYEPIYGDNKLSKIKNNDNNKFKLCIENGISLCTIDTSSMKYFKVQNAKKFLDIIVKIINDKMCDN